MYPFSSLANLFTVIFLTSLSIIPELVHYKRFRLFVVRPFRVVQHEAKASHYIYEVYHF